MRNERIFSDRCKLPLALTSVDPQWVGAILNKDKEGINK